MPNEFFFYDYECFGLRPALDRIAQFAGVRTDADFNPIGEPIMLFCQPTNDYLPNPSAIMITGITPNKCRKDGIPEPEFAQKILQAFGENTCILGYNNLRYDDEFTRFLFYRNFISPYAYSYKNGNSRWDLIDLVRACYALRPISFNWPKDEDGKVSFRLSELTKANNLAHKQPHEALSDVFSTIALAKLIKQHQPKLFDYYFNSRDKFSLQELIDFSGTNILVHISGMFNRDNHCLQLVLPITWHPQNKNAIIAILLNADIQDLFSESAEVLQERLYIKHEELEQQGLFPVPLKLIHLNRCPFLAPIKVLLPENIERLKLDIPTCLDKAKKIREEQNLAEKLSKVYLSPKVSLAENSPYLDVEARLYDNPFDSEDELKFSEVLASNGQELSQFNFKDSRLNQLLFHYRARYFQPSLSPTEQEKWQKYRLEKLKLSASNFWQQISELKEKPNSDQIILQELTNYANNILNNSITET